MYLKLQIRQYSNQVQNSGIATLFKILHTLNFAGGKAELRISNIIILLH